MGGYLTLLMGRGNKQRNFSRIKPEGDTKGVTGSTVFQEKFNKLVLNAYKRITDYYFQTTLNNLKVNYLRVIMVCFI